MQLQEFIDRHIEKIEPLEHTSRLAWWNLAVTGEETYTNQLQETNIRLRKIYSSAEDYRFLSAQPLPADSKLRRQVILLLNEYTENQIPPEMIEETVKLEAEIEAIYTNFRVTINAQNLSNYGGSMSTAIKM